jgi:NAD(P) transhydrogenase subunit alpha
MGLEVLIEKGAGANANFPDELFEKADCQIVKDAKSLFKEADIILKIRPPQAKEIKLLPENKTLISFINAIGNPELVKSLVSIR